MEATWNNTLQFQKWNETFMTKMIKNVVSSNKSNNGNNKHKIAKSNYPLLMKQTDELGLI